MEERIELSESDIAAIEKAKVKTLNSLRTDCPFCKEKAAEYLQESNNIIMGIGDTMEALDFLMNFNWDCFICKEKVYPDDVLPLSPEQAEVKKYEDMGHTVVWHSEYDAYLNYTLEKKIGVEDCGDKNCGFCSEEIDWKEIKEAY